MSSDKLITPADTRLTHKRQMWEARKNHAGKDYVEKQSFIPKSVSGGDPEYDGWSRRDRHHVTVSGHVKEDQHISDETQRARTRAKFENSKHAAQS